MRAISSALTLTLLLAIAGCSDDTGSTPGADLKRTGDGGPTIDAWVWPYDGPIPDGVKPPPPKADSGTPPPPGPGTWTKLTSPSTNDLQAIWGSAANNLFIVGNDGVILRYDGSALAAMTSGVTESLRGVHGVAANDVFAVGSGGVILRYNGSAWSTMQNPKDFGKSLASVWGSSASNLIAVGAPGGAVRFNGSAWTATSTGVSSYLYGVSGLSASDAVAVGANGEAARFDGSTWAPITTNINRNLNAVWGGSGSYIAVGFSFPLGVVLRITGGAVQEITPAGSGRLYAVTGSGSSIFVAGEGLVFRFDGSGWTTVTPPQSSQTNFNAIFALSAKDVFLAGDGGVVYRGSF